MRQITPSLQQEAGISAPLDDALYHFCISVCVTFAVLDDEPAERDTNGLLMHPFGWYIFYCQTLEKASSKL